MTIDPSTLPEDAIVEATTLAGTTFYGRAGYVLEPDDIVIRTFSPDPLPSQEVPRNEWPNIKPGSRVRMEDVTGGVHQFTVTDVGQVYVQSEINLWRHTRDIARVFVLDKPADPDADIIAEATKAALDAWNFTTVAGDACEAAARAALRVIRESGAGA